MTKARPWLAKNFRLELPGLDTSKVARIDSFAVRPPVRDSSSNISFPNLRLYISEGSAESWYSWHEDFVVNGNNDNHQEKSGALVFFAQDLGEELGRIGLQGVGIFRIGREEGEAGSDQLRRAVVDLYVESMSFRLKDGPK